jgi:hypothetical protein
MNYATRIRHAVSGGCIEVVKDAWHRPNGSGRARTYRLSVPVVPKSEWVMTYEAAFDFLMHEEPHSQSSEPPARPGKKRRLPMPTILTDPTGKTTPTQAEEHFRPLYLRRVPEQVWIQVHDNAIRSRMRLQDYIVEILKGCEPLRR